MVSFKFVITVDLDFLIKIYKFSINSTLTNKVISISLNSTIVLLV